MKRKLSVLLLLCMLIGLLPTAKSSAYKVTTERVIYSWKGNTITYSKYRYSPADAPIEEAEIVYGKKKKAKINSKTKYYKLMISDYKYHKRSKKQCKKDAGGGSYMFWVNKLVIKKGVVKAIYYGAVAG